MGERKSIKRMEVLSPDELTALVERDDPEAVGHLLYALEHGPHPYVHHDPDPGGYGRFEVVPEEWTHAVALLTQLLRTRDVSAEVIAPERIVSLKLGWPGGFELRDLLLERQSTDALERLLWLLPPTEGWIYALGSLGDRVLAPALVVANREGQTQPVAWRILCRLVSNGVRDPRIAPALVQALSDDDFSVRKEAAEALEQIADPETVPALLEVLSDADWPVRSSALSALGAIGDQRAAAAIRRLAADPESSVRTAAADALGAMGDDTAVPVLTGLLSDENISVIAHAAEALGKLRAVEPLLNALEHGSGTARWAAAKALGELGDARTAGALIAALADGKEDVRWAAAESLGKLGDAQAVPALAALLENASRRTDRILNEKVKDALQRIGGPEAERVLAPPDVDRLKEQRDIDGLILALDYEYGNTRRSAIRALAELGDARAVDPIIAVLGADDLEVRRDALGALGALGDPRTVHPIIALLGADDLEVRLDALEALGALGDERAVPALTDALGDEISGVRSLAAEALQRIGGPQAEAALADYRAG